MLLMLLMLDVTFIQFLALFHYYQIIILIIIELLSTFILYKK